MFSLLCTNLPVLSRKLRLGGWVSSSAGREDSTNITSSSFMRNYLSFHGSVACRQIAYYFSRKLIFCLNSSPLCNLFVSISSCAVPIFVWAILCQNNVFSAARLCASSTVVQCQVFFILGWGRQILIWDSFLFCFFRVFEMKDFWK